ncbi:MAG: T9SS type A sorting domain-containing protein [Chitinophagaceae bacterium]
MNKFLRFFCFLLLSTSVLHAQEFVTYLKTKPFAATESNNSVANKKKRASLPFFDDFSQAHSSYPLASLWSDSQAYINNTLGFQPITQGVATLDGLNEFGRPYVNNPFSRYYADSLTSTSINLLPYSTTSGLYLSFFYQPQGLGFAPETEDSLLLFFKSTTGQWHKVWDKRGTNLTAMQVAMIPIADTQYLHSDFQFRFVNIASPNLNDDVWNIDYVYLNAGRTPIDTIVSDMAWIGNPSSILSPYSSMPYRHFKANQSNEVSSSQTLIAVNNSNNNYTLELHHTCKEVLTGTPIANSTVVNQALSAYSTYTHNNPAFSINYNPASIFDKVIFRNQYYYKSVSTSDYPNNDTIYSDIVFDNYFAYDDGSAEKAYFLNSALNYPAKTALSFHLNQPDSLRGLSVYFGAQVPNSLGKFFSIILYKSLGGLSTQDSIIKQQDLYTVQYEPLRNGFSNYAFDTPVLLDSGIYYIGITQPANFGSDTIYYGLDVNNQSNTDFLYYNVDGTWLGSLIPGSIMMRPLVGQAFIPTSTLTVEKKNTLVLYPNPAYDKVFIHTNLELKSYSIVDVSGKKIKNGMLLQDDLTIPIHDISNGLYFIQLIDKSNAVYRHSFLKQ